VYYQILIILNLHLHQHILYFIKYSTHLPFTILPEYFVYE